MCNEEQEQDVQPKPEVRWQLGRQRVAIEGAPIVAPKPTPEEP